MQRGPLGALFASMLMVYFQTRVISSGNLISILEKGHCMFIPWKRGGTLSGHLVQGLVFAWSLAAMGQMTPIGPHTTRPGELPVDLTPLRFDYRGKSINYCPQIQSDAGHLMNPLVGMLGGARIEEYKALDTGVLAPDQRLSVVDFGFTDPDLKEHYIGDFPGQVVVVSLFNTLCEPSGRQLDEMAQLQPREKTFNMRILPVSLHTWEALRNYLRRARKIIGDVRVFVPGVGKHSLTALKQPIPAIPMTYVIDRKGRLASAWSGFFPGRLSERLREVIPEGK